MAAISLTRLLFFTILILVVVLVIALYPYYKRSKILWYTHVLPLRTVESIVKSGDIVLFRDLPTPTTMKMACSSSFTHVGLVYRRTPQSAPEIIETNAWLAILRNDFATRVQWYQQHQGPVCIRPLNMSLSLEQQRQFEQILARLPTMFGNNEDSNYLLMHPKLKRNNFKNRKKQWTYCAKKYLFGRPVPLVHTNIVDSICTDFVGHILVHLNILSADRCYACTKPAFFESLRLNEYIAENSNYHYLNERVRIQ